MKIARVVPLSKADNRSLLTNYSWVARDVIIFLKSKIKDAPKLLPLSGTRRDKFMLFNNFSAQEHASSKNRHILNFRVMAVRDMKL